MKEELADMQKSIDDNRSRRNVIRDTIADFQDKLRKQYVEQNTAKMSLNQLDEKVNEIRKGYETIQRDQLELQRQVKRSKMIIQRFPKNWKIPNVTKKN